MDCYDNLIGIHNQCTPVVPSSGFYIQDLPGINLKVANAAIDGETKSGLTLIQEKMTFAQNVIVAHIKTQASSKLRATSILSNETVGYYKDNLVSVATESGKLKGIKIKANQFPYLEFFISKLYLKLSAAVTTNIYVYDLMNDTLLDTIPITTVAKTPTVVLLNKGYLTNKQRLHLFIGIDSDVASTYETNLMPSGCHSCNGGVYSNRYVSFSGASIGSAAQKIETNISSNSGTNGLSIEYSLNCSIEPFVCNMGNQIAWALLHKTGAEIMKELIVSRRLNSIVNIDKGTNESLRDEYEAEYMASMSALLDNMKFPTDICFSCNSRIRKTVAIP